MADDELQLLVFEVAFSGDKHIVKLLPDATVGDLKEQIEDVCAVSAANQKLVGLPKAGDDAPLRGLPLKRPIQRLMLMGTRDDDLARLRAAADAAAAAAAATSSSSAAASAAASADGEDDDDDGGGGGDDFARTPTVAALIEKRIATYRPKMLAGLRPDAKRLLVLDIDYTLIDHRTPVEHPLEMMRPHLHEFLAAAYNEGGFSIVIWSATSMSWVDLKMHEMGVTRSPSFKVAALVDRGAMITVDHPTYGRVDVKPLPVLWGLIKAAGGPAYGPHNTIMFDDLRRNFLANPTSGLRITACRNMPAIRATDRELLHLSKYLLALAALPSFEGVDHRDWRRYLADVHGYRAALEDYRRRHGADGEGGSSSSSSDSKGSS